MQNRVFMLDKNKVPLMPCHPARARELLRKGKAAVYRRYPFTIILKEREGGDTQPVQLKIDPGANTTGIALVSTERVIWAADLAHKAWLTHAKLEARRKVRRNRRTRKLRYRQPRYLNRARPKGWLAPSLKSRVDNVVVWVGRLSRLCPITHLSMEWVRFDTQQMQNPEISGVEYQQGELAGYEVREYLLEKWDRQCAYCKAKDVPLQVEHITSKSRGGTDRVSNLTIACGPCNQKKGAMTAEEFGHPEVQKQARQPLKDVAAVNSTRWALWRRLNEFGLPLETGTGGRTKYNRCKQGYPKAHWMDAACVGESGEHVLLDPNMQVLRIKAVGRGSHQKCGTDKHGFPIRHFGREKRYMGFQTGDLVKAVVPSGKYAGVHVGRVTIRRRPRFRLNGFDVHPEYLSIVQRGDGYAYTF